MHCTPVQREFRLAMDESERSQHMLGQRVGEAGKCPGLPTHPLPGHVLEAGLQPGLAGLAGRILLLQLNQLLSDLLTKITHTLRLIKPSIK